MAFTTTRPERGERWRTTPVIVSKAFRTLIATAVAASVLQILDFPAAFAQVAAPSKKALKVQNKAPAKPSANDNEADQLNEKWLTEFNKSTTDTTPAATPATAKPASPQAAQTTAAPQAPTPAANPAPAPQAAPVRATAAPAGPQATAAQARAAASSVIAPPAIHPASTQAPAAAGNAVAASAPGEDERVSSVPSMITQPGAGSRAVVPGTVTFVKADNAATAFNSMPGGNQPLIKDLSKAFAGFTPNAGGAKVEMMRGRTADGSTRLLYAAIGEGKDKKGYWWFSPSDQPEGWFDNSGHRLGGTALAEPKPDSRISSPFGKRRYYGRTSGAGFHNGIDFEGKPGDPIYAAADGVINHAGWYFNYGRTVKINHADNFETLYAHMSRFAAGVAPGTTVHKGDIIGYVGSTGRSTGPHLHFSTIVDGQFVDPAPYISENGGNSSLSSQALVAFRQWQGEVRAAAVAQGKKGSVNLQGPDPWSKNPFTPPSAGGHL